MEERIKAGLAPGGLRREVVALFEGLLAKRCRKIDAQDDSQSRVVSGYSVSLWAAENSCWFVCFVWTVQGLQLAKFYGSSDKEFYFSSGKVLWEGAIFPNGDLHS